MVPPAMEAIRKAPECRVQACLTAGHVCTIMGYREYGVLARERCGVSTLRPVTGTDCGHWFRADRSAGGRILRNRPTRERARRSRKPVQPRYSPGWQPAFPGCGLPKYLKWENGSGVGSEI
jgi:hypothetical protein